MLLFYFLFAFFIKIEKQNGRSLIHDKDNRGKDEPVHVEVRDKKEEKGYKSRYGEKDTSCNPERSIEFLHVCACIYHKYSFWGISLDSRHKISSLPGTNNEYETGCLIVFDSSDVAGASPQKDDKFRCVQLLRGSEKHYILLPRIEWALGGSIIESSSKFDVLQNRRLSVFTHFSNLYYEFDFNGRLVDIRTSHVFEMKYEEVFLIRNLSSTQNLSENSQRKCSTTMAKIGCKSLVEWKRNNKICAFIHFAVYRDFGIVVFGNPLHNRKA